MNPAKSEYRSLAYPYFSTLGGYSENTLGFMKFNPPLSASIPYPYARNKDPEIKYQFDYDSLSYPESTQSVNLNCFYPSVTNAYRK